MGEIIIWSSDKFLTTFMVHFILIEKDKKTKNTEEILSNSKVI